nr:hypothetical protein [Angustibacter aerolatus]
MADPGAPVVRSGDVEPVRRRHAPDDRRGRRQPRPSSRTLSLAALVAERLARLTSAPSASVVVLDLARLTEQARCTAGRRLGGPVAGTARQPARGRRARRRHAHLQGRLHRPAEVVPRPRRGGRAGRRGRGAGDHGGRPGAHAGRRRAPATAAARAWAPRRPRPRWWSASSRSTPRTTWSTRGSPATPRRRAAAAATVS